VRIDIFPKLVISVLYLGCLMAASMIAEAQETKSDDGWKFKAAIYLWGAGVGGTTQRGNEVDVTFSDIISNLDMAFMGAFEARKSKWSLVADAIYLDVSADKAGTIGATGIPNNADVSVQGWVLNLHGGRNVFGNQRASVDVLAGARYLDSKSKLNLSLGSAGPAGSVSTSGSVWDGVIGVKGNVNITEQWYLPYYLDVGTGQSDLTWQGLAGVGYRFKPVDVVLAYRHIYWDFKSGNGFSDLTFSGPALGVVFKF